MERVVAKRAVDHRKHARDCVAMAMHAQDESDKALWLTLAQSWVRLAEYVARAEEAKVADDKDGDRPTRSPDAPEDEEAAPPSLDAIAPYWP